MSCETNRNHQRDCSTNEIVFVYVGVCVFISSHCLHIEYQDPHSSRVRLRLQSGGILLEPTTANYCLRVEFGKTLGNVLAL